jgi:hypothetical protein
MIYEPQRPQCSNWLYWTILFPMQDVHPSDCLGIASLAEIDLRGFPGTIYAKQI